MSNAETSNLEQLVSRHILTRESQQQLSDSDLQTASARIRNERIRLENVLTQILCSNETDMVIQRKIRHNHIRLVQLSNNIYDTIRIAQESNGEHRLASITLDEINHLMHTAELMASNYIDVTIPLAHFVVAQWKAELLESYSGFEQLLREQLVDPQLLNALDSLMHSFETANREITEAQFRYAEKLLRGVGKMIANEPKEMWDARLLRLMVYFNFNKRETMSYLSEKIKAMGMVAEPFLLIQERLVTFLKEIKQMEENLSYIYLRDRPSLKSYAIELIEEELACMQQHRTNLLTEISNGDNAYFIVDLTVRKLNLWVQINVEMGTIPYHSTPHVVKVMSQYVRTLKPGPISYESARRKLDNYDPTTVKGLHQWLTRQIAHLEKKYSEQLFYQK